MIPVKMSYVDVDIFFDFQASIRLSIFSGSGKFHHDLQYAEPYSHGSQMNDDFVVLTSQQLCPCIKSFSMV